MKKIFFAISFNLLFNFFSIAVIAQSTENAIEPIDSPTPKWVTDNGYWVVETNMNTPTINTIYFYNNDKVMVYKENVNGVLIKLEKKRVKIALNKMLKQSILAYNQKPGSTENKMLVVNLIKR